MLICVYVCIHISIHWMCTILYVRAAATRPRSDPDAFRVVPNGQGILCCGCSLVGKCGSYYVSPFIYIYIYMLMSFQVWLFVGLVHLLFATAQPFYSFAIFQLRSKTDCSSRCDAASSAFPLYQWTQSEQRTVATPANGPVWELLWMPRPCSKALASQECHERINAGPGDGRWTQSSHSTVHGFFQKTSL